MEIKDQDDEKQLRSPKIVPAAQQQDTEDYAIGLFLIVFSLVIVCDTLGSQIKNSDALKQTSTFFGPYFPPLVELAKWFLLFTILLQAVEKSFEAVCNEVRLTLGYL